MDQKLTSTCPKFKVLTQIYINKQITRVCTPASVYVEVACLIHQNIVYIYNTG